MPPAEPATHGAEGVLWLFSVVALIVLVLAAQVAFGYGREARLARRVAPDPRRFGLALAAGAAAFGSGLWAAMVLAMATEPWGLTTGYHPLGLGLVWLGAMALGAAVIGPAARDPSRLAVIGGGLLAGIGVPLLQVALVAATDSDPGIDWDIPEAVLAVIVAALGSTVAIRVVFRGEGRHGRHRHLLRWAAAVLVGIAVTVAQNLMLAGAALPEQVLALGSERPSQLIAATIAAVVVPAALAAGLIRLWLLGEARRRPPVAADDSAAAGRKRRPSQA
jgi:NO-binding membrane sensor protein with MHYT domain